MRKLIAFSLILLPLAFSGNVYAGKFTGSGVNHNQPTHASAGSSQCNGPQYHYLNNPCAPSGSTTRTQPHGGCGYYGPNGVLIRCE